MLQESFRIMAAYFGVGLMVCMLSPASVHAAQPAKSKNEPDTLYDIDPAEASLNQHYHQAQRPQFHYTPIQGHIGDATGLIYNNGQFHLFYMFDKWERRRNRHKCWGHAISRDLLHWEEQPPILDPVIDHKPGSGSGIVDWNNTLGLRSGSQPTLAVFYTDYATGSCIAYSTDSGRSWTRHPRNPVLADANDARDPVVFWHPPDHEWRMVRYEKQGFVFYGSTNLLDWTQFSRVDGFYECPDIFELPVEGGAGERKWVLVAADYTCVIGSFTGREFKVESPKLRLEAGKNLYAPQTWKTGSGKDSRVIQMGFMRYPREPLLTWQNQMMFPCQLTLRTFPEGLRVCREPVDDIEKLRINRRDWRNLKLDPGVNPLKEVHGELFEIRAQIDLAHADSFSLTVRGQTIRYSVKDGQLSFAGITAPLKAFENRLQLHVLVDRSSIEVFADRGRVAMSKAVFLDPSQTDVALVTEGGHANVVSLEFSELGSIWPEAKK
jgi:sucrose-6-phosphate hydrolase SacC (GH32 family)